MEYKCGVTSENITELNDNEIFVFGSNTAGLHGAGAAHAALKFGAEMGKGIGLQGNTYALPTKDHNIRTLDIDNIEYHVGNLWLCILKNPSKHFLITKIGCGLAGYTAGTIAPLFSGFINQQNCSLPLEFIEIINNKK